MRILILTSCIGLLLLGLWLTDTSVQPPASPAEAYEKMSRVERERGRADYFHRMYKDPATGEIPPNVRNREVAFAKNLSKRAPGEMAKSQVATWTEVGPNNVGGRTRGLAVDVTNSNTIIAGGVNGGIWKSTNLGVNWTLKSRPDLGITSIAQDPRTGQTATWYAGTGELQGSADASGAFYRGEGLWKSTDSGETWACIQGCTPDLVFNSEWDYIDRVAVSPTSGTVFVASNSYGIYRSADGGTSFTNVRTATGNTDVDVHATTGRVLVSTAGGPSEVAFSDDDGATFTAANLASTGAYNRGLVAFANSDATGNTAYSLIYTGAAAPEAAGKVLAHDLMRLDLLDLGTNTATDRSANVPKLGTQGLGFFDTQGGYNIVLEVKNNDANFVLVGGTSLFRSRDGFATSIPNTGAGRADGWIGGYATADDVSQYTNHHPDQHLFVFDPNNPTAVWSCHDGGLSYIADITTVIPDGGEVSWLNRDTGYNVTQFYDIDQYPANGDTRIMGGLQDNGTPFFRTTTGTQTDVTTGDGAFADFGTTIAVASSQNAGLNRYTYTGGGDLQYEGSFKPTGATGILFIHPFELDPNNEQVMYFPGGDHMWRNNSVGTATPTTGWAELTNVSATAGYQITALAVSETNPMHRLYYAANNDAGGKPKMFRLDAANTATNGEVEISDAAWADGAYPKHIAINSSDANEIMVVFSNYNVANVWWSTNGGTSWTNVTGNLGGAQFGPSIRAAAIASTTAGKIYFVGTSTGIYSTGTLPVAASKTQATWVQESPAGIGFTPINMLHYRSGDGKLATGTHGRGAWTAQFTPLPVELTSFEAVADAGDVLLQWATASEVNNAGFEVEQETAEDAWTQIGYVDGAGSTVEPQAYSFRVNDLLPGTHRFRLRQVDFDGTFEYSGTVEALVEVPGSHTLTAAYPNPFNPQATFSLAVATDQDVRVTVHDLNGRLVQTLHNGAMRANESQQFRIDGSGLSSGLYFYRVVGLNFTDTKQITLVK